MSGTKKKISFKLYGLVALAALGTIITSFVMISDIKSAMYQSKKDELRSLVESAHSILIAYQKKTEGGGLDKAKAQAEAIKLLQELRYQKDQYFWVNDTHPKMIMHPTQPSMNGSDLSDVVDANGSKFFIEFVKVAKETATQEMGGGYVDYHFPKPNTTEAFPKISFVKLFEPWGWVIGTGVYVDDLNSNILSNTYKIGGIAALVLASIAIVSIMIARNISQPVQQITGVMLQLADGNASVTLPENNRSDEFGDMLKALLIFKKNIVERQRLESVQSQQKEASDNDRKRAFSKMAEDFESSIKSVIDTVSNAAARMKTASSSMVSTVSDNVGRTETISHSSEEASANVETVATAAEQMASSIHDISSKVSESSRIAKTAVEEIHRTNQVVKGLAEASEAIGEIVNLIQDIAEQTNLLALNATIEAARAGDAGKGFAVVASEVKNLANQTSKATEQIAQQISSIQGITDNAVSAIGGIGATIDRMNSISGTIANAIEEQGIATREISGNMTKAATGTRDVTKNVIALNKSTKAYGETANEVSNASQELNKQVEILQNQVNSFVRNIRSA